MSFRINMLGPGMKNKSLAVFTLSLAVAAAALAAPQPKITMAQARATALKKAHGTVKSAELENEHGKLIYSFDIATSKSNITEVNVDAMTGKVIAVQQENAAKEAAEKQQEAKH
jgi:uncharacterized membrane protein YkoI